MTGSSATPPEYDVRPLVDRVEALLPVVTQLAQDTYAAHWSFFDALDVDISDEEYDEAAAATGIRALYDGMSDLTCQAAAGVDFYLLADPPAWFTVQEARRQAWNGIGVEGRAR